MFTTISLMLPSKALHGKLSMALCLMSLGFDPSVAASPYSVAGTKSLTTNWLHAASHAYMLVWDSTLATKAGSAGCQS
jgi:hypothetical protein